MTDIELQGVTTSGLPYPESTAALQQGANDIKALALALDPRAPRKLMLVKQTITTDANGLFSIVAPGTVAAVVLTYLGVYHPMIVNIRSITGSTVVAAFNRTDSSAIANATLDVVGVVFHA
jgi:hypothetical protein